MGHKRAAQRGTHSSAGRPHGVASDLSLRSCSSTQKIFQSQPTHYMKGTLRALLRAHMAPCLRYMATLRRRHPHNTSRRTYLDLVMIISSNLREMREIRPGQMSRLPTTYKIVSNTPAVYFHPKLREMREIRPGQMSRLPTTYKIVSNTPAVYFHPKSCATCLPSINGKGAE